MPNAYPDIEIVRPSNEKCAPQVKLCTSVLQRVDLNNMKLVSRLQIGIPPVQSVWPINTKCAV